MRKYFFLLLVGLCMVSYAQDKIAFNASLELNTKYVWRGIAYGNSPTFFPTIGLNYKGLSASAGGGYNFNGTHSEVDLYLSYTHSDLTIGVNDYFFPDEKAPKGKYMNFKRNETPHSIEAYLTYSPERLPLWFTASSFIYGNDRTISGNNQYSTYIEFGGYLKLRAGQDRLNLCMGLTPHKGLYANKFAIVNVQLKYETGFSFGGRWELPVSGSLIVNPDTGQPYLSFSTYFSTK